MRIVYKSILARRVLVHSTILRAGSAGLLALSAIGCASSQTSGGSPSVVSQANSGALGPALLQWSGRFRAKIRQSANLSSPTPTRSGATGSVMLTAANPSQTAVHLTVSLPQFSTQPVQLNWTVSSGSCGSNSIPIMSVSQFPQIAVNSGSGTLDASLPFALPTTGDYHVNIYDNGADGRDESGVITCAPLKLELRSSGI